MDFCAARRLVALPAAFHDMHRHHMTFDALYISVIRCLPPYSTRPPSFSAPVPKAAGDARSAV